MSQARKGILGLFALVFMFFIIFLIFSIFSLKKIGTSGDDNLLSNSDSEIIAVVDIKGVIMESKKIIESLHKAEKKKNVKAIFIRVNSPGGAVGPSQEIYEEILRIDQEKKPVYASLGTVAASGGYYVAAAARKIYSNPGTLTGSIGVIMQTADLSELYKWVKIRPETLKAGKYKDVGSPSRKMTPEERKMMEGMISNVHQQFISDILKRRKDKIVGDIKEHAEGQVFSGEMAKNIGLVDDLKGLWSAARDVHKELNLKGELKLVFVKDKKKPFSLSDFVDYMDEAEGLFKGLKGLLAPKMLYFK